MLGQSWGGHLEDLSTILKALSVTLEYQTETGSTARYALQFLAV